MYLHNINPDIISFGPFSIRFYGIVYALGFLGVSYYLASEAKHIKNLDKNKAFDLVIYGMIFAIICARALHVINDWGYYSSNLLQIFMIWRGGLAFFGGIFGSALAAYIYCRKNKIDFLSVADRVVLFMPLIVFFGRIANFINAEHYGYPTNLPWAVIFPVDSIPRHPAQIYEGISMLLLFGILLIVHKYTKKRGLVFISFLVFYSILRFITEFFRFSETLYFGLSDAQVLCVWLFCIGGYLSVKEWRRVR
ncbi:MAG: prolipoprotein diacylglyceryl transferase [archaeon]